MRQIEHWLELGGEDELAESLRATVEGYNDDDCRSAASLRDWLEDERRKLEESGTTIPRPAIGEGAPSEELVRTNFYQAGLFINGVHGYVVHQRRRPWNGPLYPLINSFLSKIECRVIEKRRNQTKA